MVSARLQFLQWASSIRGPFGHVELQTRCPRLAVCPNRLILPAAVFPLWGVLDGCDLSRSPDGPIPLGETPAAFPPEPTRSDTQGPTTRSATVVASQISFLRLMREPTSALRGLPMGRASDRVSTSGNLHERWGCNYLGSLRSMEVELIAAPIFGQARSRMLHTCAAGMYKPRLLCSCQQFDPVHRHWHGGARSGPPS